MTLPVALAAGLGGEGDTGRGWSSTRAERAPRRACAAPCERRRDALLAPRTVVAATSLSQSIDLESQPGSWKAALRNRSRATDIGGPLANGNISSSAPRAGPGKMVFLVCGTTGRHRSAAGGRPEGPSDNPAHRRRGTAATVAAQDRSRAILGHRHVSRRRGW
jgi:hypothetical protein